MYYTLLEDHLQNDIDNLFNCVTCITLRIAIIVKTMAQTCLHLNTSTCCINIVCKIDGDNNFEPRRINSHHERHFQTKARPCLQPNTLNCYINVVRQPNSETCFKLDTSNRNINIAYRPIATKKSI